MDGHLYLMQRFCWSSYNFSPINFVFNAKIYFVEICRAVGLKYYTKSSSEDPLCAIYRVGRTLEAKDAARGALKTPWWTLGCKYQVWNTDYSVHALPSLMILLLHNNTTPSHTPDYFGDIKWVCLVPIQEVADMAQWEDEQIEYIKEKVTEKGKQEDLQKGKPPAQVLYQLITYLLLVDQ